MTNDLKLSEFLPYRLSVLSNTVSRRIAERYAAEFDINVGQWRVLAVIGETPGLTATEITQRTAMDKVAVSRAVSGLIDKNLIVRTAAQSDGRCSILKMTREGNDLYARIVPMAQSIEAEVTKTLSEDELTVLNGLLSKLARQASPDRSLW
ncbi:MAG: MarR family winged helix-turn-helix transcriptional regulator [Pseudomonadota bacterium]